MLGSPHVCDNARYPGDSFRDILPLEQYIGADLFTFGVIVRKRISRLSRESEEDIEGSMSPWPHRI